MYALTILFKYGKGNFVAQWVTIFSSQKKEKKKENGSYLLFSWYYKY